MSLTIGNIVLRVDDLELEAGFWAAALGYERRPVDADDFAQVVSPDRSGPSISFDRYRAAERVPRRAQSPNASGPDMSWRSVMTSPGAPNRTSWCA